jgi:electron transport protein HydN
LAEKTGEEMNKLVIADPGKCIGCRTCEIACVLAHAGGDAMVKMSPASFNPRLTVVKTNKVSTPVQCRQCEDAPCAAVCPTGTLVLRNNSVEVNPSRCIGCKSCMIACRFGVIEVLPFEATLADRPIISGTHVEAVKCDLCAHRANGPACAEVCPTKAISVIDSVVLAEAARRRREQAAIAQASISSNEYPGQMAT